MKQKIVFLVGPDRCGKTEIGKALAKRLGAMYFKASSEHNAYLQSIGRRSPSYLSGHASADFSVARDSARRVSKARDEGWTGVDERTCEGKLCKSELSPVALSSPELFLNQLRYADPRMCDFVRQLGEQFGTSVVFDRGFPCEYAYSQVKNRETDLAMIDYMNNAWSKLGAKIVFCHRESYDGVVDDIDPKINQDMLEQLDAAYKEFFEKENAFGFRRCEYLDLTVDNKDHFEDLEWEVSEILRFLEV